MNLYNFTIKTYIQKYIFVVQINISNVCEYKLKVMKKDITGLTSRCHGDFFEYMSVEGKVEGKIDSLEANRRSLKYQLLMTETLCSLEEIYIFTNAPVNASRVTTFTRQLTTVP